MGAGYTLDYQVGYPVTANDEWMAARVTEYAEDTVGADNVVVPEKTMGGEDMSFFLQHSRGCFFFMGVEREGSMPLHHPQFDFNEDVLLTGVEIYCRAALDFLKTD